MCSPTVSITLPTYNRADLLPDVLKTILTQDYQEFELIIVDDGSTDNTADVIAEIAARDVRVRYIPLPGNRGIGYARNAALKHVHGRYVALADSDDKWLPSKLKAQVETLEAHPEIDILFGDFLNIDYIRGLTLNAFVDAWTGMACLKTHHVVDDLWVIESGIEKGLLVNNFIGTPTMLLRTNVFARVGGFNPTLNTPTDHEFCWRAAVLGAQFAYLNRILIERYRYTSSSTARIADALTQMLQAFRVFRETAIKINRPELLQYIKMAEHLEWRKLLWHYGRHNERRKVISTYGQSLRYGFSLKTLIFFLTALPGPGLARRWTSFRMWQRDI